MAKWLPVVGYEDRYLVSDSGHVYSIRSRKLLRPGIGTTGYKYVWLCNDTTKERQKIHTVVLNAFTGPRPTGMECRHLNGKRMDNRRCNLCWGTVSENKLDTVKHGTHPSCKMRGNGGIRKLTNDDIVWVRANQNRYTRTIIAEVLGISRRYIGMLLRNQRRQRDGLSAGPTQGE